ncbi:hypothetical protein K9L67_02510, partial [Candidatus Woesearchaeota archaeon]|nr:hypothetical protein [Candidatus Woesearchaeota archaeon]
MKKAQTHQVFFYIMVIIVVGAVVLIGYSAIGDILKKQCDISKITFKDDMKEKLDSNRNYGYSENKEIKVPCNVETICFLNETLTN